MVEEEKKITKSPKTEAPELDVEKAKREDLQKQNVGSDKEFMSKNTYSQLPQKKEPLKS